MTDKERVARLLSDISRWTAELQSYHITDVRHLKDSKTYFAASMLSFQILNAVLDLCDEVITAKNLGVPSTYKDIFWLLERGGIITAAIRQQIWSIVKYRNMLAHEYGEVSEKDVLSIVQRLDTLQKFVSQLKRHLV